MLGTVICRADNSQGPITASTSLAIVTNRCSERDHAPRFQMLFTT